MQKARARHAAITKNLYTWSNYKNWADRMKDSFEDEPAAKPEPGNGGPSAVEETFSDWRDAGGLKAPFKTTIQQNGKKFADVTVQEFKLNTGLKAEELSKKP